MEHEKYAWPGGYARFAVMGDGEILCVDCVNDPNNPVHNATTDLLDSMFAPANEWIIVGWSHTGETDEVGNCANCNKEIS